MQLRIKATDYQLTPETEAYVNTRAQTLERLLGEHAAVTRIEIEVGKDAGKSRHGSNMYFAEIRVLSPGGTAVYARNNSESINGAIDDVKEEVERQLRKQKSFSMHYLRKSGALLKRLMRFGDEEV